MLGLADPRPRIPSRTEDKILNQSLNYESRTIKCPWETSDPSEWKIHLEDNHVSTAKSQGFLAEASTKSDFKHMSSAQILKIVTLNDCAYNDHNDCTLQNWLFTKKRHWVHVWAP